MSTGVAVEGGPGAPVFPDGDLQFGPQWKRIVDDSDGIDLDVHLADGITLSTERDAHTAMGNTEPPTCAACGAELDMGEFVEMIQPWLDDGEPTVTCAECGHADLLGNWPAPWGIAVGTPAVTFNNWPRLTDEFLAELRSRLSPRTMVIYGRV